MTESSITLELPALPDNLGCEVSRAVLPWFVAGLAGTIKVDGASMVVEWPTSDEGRERVAAPMEEWRWGGDGAAKVRTAFDNSTTWLNAQPAGQPSRVHELSESLLAPYRAEGGRVHLGGCTLDWLPVWRRFVATPVTDSTNGNVDAYQLELQHVGTGGEPLEEGEAAGFEQVALLPTAPSDCDAPPDNGARVVLQLPIWRCWVRGRVVAEIDESSVSVDVEGWATEIVSGDFLYPPFDTGCGQPSHCAALDDEGDIGPDTAMAVCAESNQRLLCSKMQRCGSSEVWVLPKHVRPCPVTGVGVRESELIACNMCRQRVAPQAISAGRCEVCRSLKPVAKEDAQVARIIGEYPRLDQWSAWRIGESRDCLVLTAGRFLWRLLVVVKKEPPEIVHAATGLRWIRGWTDAPEELKRELRSTE